MSHKSSHMTAWFEWVQSLACQVRSNSKFVIFGFDLTLIWIFMPTRIYIVCDDSTILAYCEIEICTYQYQHSTYAYIDFEICTKYKKKLRKSALNHQSNICEGVYKNLEAISAFLMQPPRAPKIYQTKNYIRPEFFFLQFYYYWAAVW